MSVKKDTYKIQAQTIIKNLARRNVEGFYCDTKEDAVKKALEIMEKGSVIAWGRLRIHQGMRTYGGYF